MLCLWRVLCVVVASLRRREKSVLQPWLDACGGLPEPIQLLSELLLDPLIQMPVYPSAASSRGLSAQALRNSLGIGAQVDEKWRVGMSQVVVADGVRQSCAP